jgi:thiamine-phosphate pyrophosphorylase
VSPPLYAIIDAVWLSTSELAFAEILAESGVELIQYRHKQISTRNLFLISQEMAARLRLRGVRFIVNDRPDIAAMVDAGGVHVGQEDLPVELARKVCGPDRWVGISTHTLEQVREADATSADYVAVGPIFSTTTKREHGPVVGTEFIRRARQLTRKPIVAIGGITLERAAEVFAAGADSIAVAKDLLTAEDARQRAKEFLSITAQASARRLGKAP